MHSVLIIDDDIEYLRTLTQRLSSSFDVKYANSLDVADDLLKENIQFDVAVVNENVGGQHGSDWIARTKINGMLLMSFVLYSNSASEEVILKGLECGADDFLSQPFSLLALHSKLEKLVNYQDKIHHFEDEIKSKDSIIHISMAQASKYGSCMQLTSKLNHCFTLEQIRDEVFTYFHNMGLHGCIAFYPLNEKPSFYSAQKALCSPVEIDVMKLLKVKPRLYQFGSRTIFNHQLVSLLILNLEEGTVDTDIYIDALASVIECIGARMAFITYKNSLIEVQEQIKQAVKSTKKMVGVSKHHQQEVMNDIVQRMGTSFHILDMTQVQEDYLTDLVHGALKKHSQDDMNFLEVSALLDQALVSVDQLQQLNVEQTATACDSEIDDEDELF
ncbi:response regulator [Colwellia sp. D2M02]|uniref:response regulator n=1 Tax=Colwellia sp. D2M02 TaxID=2841562 RepID=UPI001C09EBC4|nr:response regulator [Colwellia sp. D2M02]MBU2892571.1 response regulator [Colwellia sp. D2M02]